MSYNNKIQSRESAIFFCGPDSCAVSRVILVLIPLLLLFSTLTSCSFFEDPSAISTTESTESADSSSSGNTSNPTGTSDTSNPIDSSGASATVVSLNPLKEQKPGDLSVNSFTVSWDSLDFTGAKKADGNVLATSDLTLELYYLRSSAQISDSTKPAAPSVQKVLADGTKITIQNGSITQATVSGLSDEAYYYYVVLKSINNTDTSKTDLSDTAYRFTTYRKDYVPLTLTKLKEFIAAEIGTQGNNADLNIIDTSNVTSLESTFDRNATFNGDISLWDVSKVESMLNMFLEATAFNGNISQWKINTTNSVNMSYMFTGATNFNGDISSWNVSKVNTMRNMFSRTKNFNIDISAWDISSVYAFTEMFLNAEKFDRNLSSWNLRSTDETTDMFKNSLMETKTTWHPIKS